VKTMAKKAMTRELIRLRARVLDWRRGGGGRGTKMPSELWEEAVRVACESGVWATAHASGLKYESLRARVGDPGGKRGIGGRRPRGEAAAAGSAEGGGLGRGVSRRSVSRRRGEVEGREEQALCERREDALLPGAQFVALRVAPAAGVQTTIELEGRGGDRMRIEVAGGVDVVGMVQAFWGRAS